MHTERLYYEDPTLSTFTARVLGARTLDGRPAVALDRTAFYPTGGGQPNDTGDLAGRTVLDVLAEDGLIWHILDAVPEAAPAVGAEVKGSLDWHRRLDHMQQHTGQHILSEAFIVTLDAHTVAFHMGATACTIDVNRTGLSVDDLARAEEAANEVVERALPVSARFVTEQELAAMRLRKAPAVEGPIRIVEVAGYDWSPCGGTHLANSAEVGLIKVTGIERRGGDTRITFLCGRRARRDYARLQALLEGLAGRFTVGQDELPLAVDRLANEGRVLRKELEGLEEEWAAAKAAELAATALEVNGLRIVSTVLEGSVDRAKKLAQALRVLPRVAVFLGVGGPRPQLLFTRSDDAASVNAGELLRAAAAAAGGRGGGRPDWAQGGVPDEGGLRAALQTAVERLKG